MTEGNGANPRRISPLDLSYEQMEALELEFGKPYERWEELPSRFRTMRRVLEVYNGEPEGTRLHHPIRELTQLVDLEDAEPDPTPAATG